MFDMIYHTSDDYFFHGLATNLILVKEYVKRLMFVRPLLQVPFPMGVNVRPRPGKNRASNSEESILESSQKEPNGEIPTSIGEETSGSFKDTD